ncbi:MAG: RidA family protein [Actinomycetota bacterium]
MGPERQVVSSADAPPALGPYSQAVRCGDLVFCAGQIGLDPSSGELVVGGIRSQTRRVLDNLRAVLQAAGLGLDRVVKTTVFLASMEDFSAMNEIYAEFFSESPPARATVEVSGLPRAALVEIEAIARGSP